jgi:hypothetical protein
VHWLRQDRKKDGIVRWRRINLKRVIAERFGVDFHPRYVGKLLKKLGFSHISARPRHPAQDERITSFVRSQCMSSCTIGSAKSWSSVGSSERRRADDASGAAPPSGA